MRNILYFICFFIFFLSFSALAQSPRPGTVPATTDGWTMTASIDGKPFVATSLAIPEVYSRIIGYQKEAYIGMSYWKRWTAGEKSMFRHGNAVDLSIDGDPNFWAGYTGELEITKVSNGWVEGRFHFTATTRGSDKKIEVTNGFFRIKNN